MTINKSACLFEKRAFILGTNGSFSTPYDALGGVGGLSLKKNTIKMATTVPMIACVISDQYMSSLALSLLIAKLSVGSTNIEGMTKPRAAPRGIAAVATVVAIIL